MKDTAGKTTAGSGRKKAPLFAGLFCLPGAACYFFFAAFFVAFFTAFFVAFLAAFFAGAFLAAAFFAAFFTAKLVLPRLVDFLLLALFFLTTDFFVALLPPRAPLLGLAADFFAAFLAGAFFAAFFAGAFFAAFLAAFFGAAFFFAAGSADPGAAASPLSTSSAVAAGSSVSGRSSSSSSRSSSSEEIEMLTSSSSSSPKPSSTSSGSLWSKSLSSCAKSLRSSCMKCPPAAAPEFSVLSQRARKVSAFPVRGL
ncbi:MAG TPA: hypothetical protein VFA02_03330 [Pseudacidobacterium sp.]|nr:hypothetical protein [Pseudacidobacterium sp.]